MYGLAASEAFPLVAEVEWANASRACGIEWQRGRPGECSDACRGTPQPERSLQSQKEQRWADLTAAVFACAVPMASRPAVAQVPVPSLAVGLVGSMGSVVRVPESARSAVRMAATLLREEWPRATFTTLQINHGFGTLPHVDAYSVGLSYT